MPSANTETAWERLTAHKAELKGTRILKLFEQTPSRYAEMSCRAAGLTFDYSKNIANTNTMVLLFQLAREHELEARIKQLISGKPVNSTEKRPALHTALRDSSCVDEELAQTVEDTFLQMGKFVAATTNVANAATFGSIKANVFPMWDWVGGRYSLWSAIGLPIALAVGMDNFNGLRAGAAEMDRHFASTPLEQNMPVIAAMLGVWYINFCKAHSHAIIPYDHYLRYFAKFLQQLDMESNGNSASGEAFVDCQTGPIIWGEAGTNDQYSFHQLLHQGTRLVPHKVMPGNRPGNTIVLKKVLSRTLIKTRQQRTNREASQAMTTAEATVAEPAPQTQRTPLLDRDEEINITLISLHGLIHTHAPELGRDADTGGQISYVLQLARELAAQPHVIGIIEGINYYHFLDNIVIPNDQIGA